MAAVDQYAGRIERGVTASDVEDLRRQLRDAEAQRDAWKRVVDDIVGALAAAAGMSAAEAMAIVEGLARPSVEH